MTEYTLEFRLCGAVDCNTYKLVGRSVRTPDVDVGEKNLRKEVLRWMTLPVENKDDTKHFLPPEEARKHIDSTNPTLKDLLSVIPNAKATTVEKKIMEERKKKDKHNTFNATKVRAVADCDVCGASRAVLSAKKVGTSDGPSEQDLKDLEQSLENNGYICGNKIKGGNGKFYAKRAIFCGYPIESIYYNPDTGTKGGRIVTKDICAVCYVDDDLVSPDEIKRSQDVGGKNPLTICRGCFNDGVEPPCLGGRRNVAQTMQQRKNAKKRRHDAVASAGRQKPRNSS